MNSGDGHPSDSHDSLLTFIPMKRLILTIAISSSLFAVVPALQARDWDRDHDRSSEYRGGGGGYDEIRSDTRKLWEWYGRLKDDVNDHGGRRNRERMDDARGDLRRVEVQLRNGGVRRDVLRSEVDGVRETLRSVSEDLHSRRDHDDGDGRRRSFFGIRIR